MDITTLTTEEIIRFAWRVQENEYIYMNTWEMPKNEWDQMTQADIEAKQQQEYKAWREIMGTVGAR
jgi:hypothetical protein